MKTTYWITCMVLLLVSVRSFPQSTSGDHTISITKEKLLSANLQDYVPEFPKDTYSIASFKVTLAGKGKDLYEYSIMGDQFTEDLRLRLRVLLPGDKVYVEYIRVKSRNGHIDATKNFPPFAFVIAAK